MIRTHLFPLFSKLGGILLATISFITALALFGFAVPSFIESLNAERGSLLELNIVRFSIALASIVLTGLDLIIKIWQSVKSYRESSTHKQTYDISHDEECKRCSWVKIKRFISKYVIDIIRMMVAEAILYPTVICNILDNASSRTYAGTFNDKFKFARFILSAGWLVFHVYIVRLLVIGTTIVSLEAMRRGKRILRSKEDESAQLHLDRGWNMFDNEHDSKKRAVRGLVLEIFFLVHVLGQMLTQSLMLAAIWSKVECENLFPTPGGVVYVSPFTWVMIVLGFVLPIAGTFTFFIPNYVWAQEFPIDFMVNVLSVLKKCGPLGIKEAAIKNAERIESTIASIESDLTKRKMNLC